jgi:transposase InsO family protein
LYSGGRVNWNNYKIWDWTALAWLKDTMNEQARSSGDGLVGVWPALDGYCLNLTGTNVFYGLKHAEVLGAAFNPRRILNQMHVAVTIREEDRPSIFRDSALNRRQGIMAHAIKLMVGVSQARGRTKGTEGVLPIERTAMRPKDQSRKVPEPVVVQAEINGHRIRALLDTGSMADFLSTTLVDQLELRKEYYSKPLSVQLAVHGSRSKINCGVRVNFRYQNIDVERRFDVANLDNYDAILGTPFLFQHKVAVGINPSCVVVGSDTPVELDGPDVITISSAAADLMNDKLDGLRNELRRSAEDLCTDTSKTTLPPLRAVNHTIPLIDEHKVYHFRPSKCPEAFREQWREKKEAYLATGRWRTATGHNAIPLLMIPKVSSTGEKPGLRTVFDKREQNQNTYKLASPLPDIEEILREVSKHQFRSLIDGKDAYEQIRVIPDHVPRTLFTTPDGTMESLVMQQGDCNAGATYQTLMNHIFASYIGVFMFVYLDDIIIFSDTIEDHMIHVKIVFDILRKERLFLSPNKMQFFAEELKILGHVIDDMGIRMDPHKVDKVTNWKTPTNKDLLRSFIGAVGFLAPDCKGVRIPMGHLSSLTAETRPWRWDDTAQRSFDKVKQIVNEYRDKRRKALDYSSGADPIYVTTDGCLTGGGGYVSQGRDPGTASVVAFWSGKWNAAQQNYPVHEQELLALVETLRRFRGVLHGTRFLVRTDHKALEYFMKQRNLSPRQHRWIDTLSEFDFDIQYIPGDTNGLADALSRIYSDEPRGITRAESEFIDEGPDVDARKTTKIHPVYIETYLLDLMNAETRKSSRLANKPSPRYKETGDRRPREKRTRKEEPVQSQPSVSKLVDTAEAPHAESKPDRRPETPVHIGNKLFEVSSDLGISFPDCIRNRYNEDRFFEPILANPTEFTNFEVGDGLVYFVSEGTRTVAIPDVKVDGRNVREVLISQGHSILAHLSDEKTATYMRDQVWWKTMIKDVSDYCRSCQICAVSKPQSGKPHGKLKTMPVPTYPWLYVGVDFVGPLPESSNRDGAFDMICVVIDQLTSMVHLIPSRQTYRATDIAELMFENVYKLHGLPERIISDRDSLFTSKFWRRLHRLLGTELRMSSAFHPQTDGATERANRTVTQMIRQCVRPDQKDWVFKLPAIEFAINSARSSTTGFSPFQLNYGRNPSPMIWQGQEEFPGVRRFAERMKLAMMSAHDAIIAARIVNTVQANRKRAVAEYKLGDLVYLSTKNITLPKGRARQLAPRYLGPFAITKVLKEGATYQLNLSDELVKRGINRSFHASLLKPHVPGDDRRFPGRLPSQIPGFGEKPEEWIVESIIAHHGKGTRSDFEILWKAGDHTWAPYREVAHLIAMDRYCELMGVESPNDLPAAYPKRDEVLEVSVSAIRLGREGYKFEHPRGVNTHLLAMTHTFSDDEWDECATYAFRYDRFVRAGRHPSQNPGPPPPRIGEYRRIVSLGYTSNPTNYAAHHEAAFYGAHAPHSQNTISMPPEALTSFFDAQIRMVELMHGGTRLVPTAPRPRPIPRPYFKPRAFKPSRGRGNGRGRGSSNRGRFGRARPSLSLNKQGPKALAEDVAMTDASSLTDDVFDMFGLGVDDNQAGSSSMTITTPDVSVIGVTPGMVGSSSNWGSTHQVVFPGLEELAEQLVGEIGDIDIEGLTANEGDPDPSGKGKGVDRDTNFE